MININFTSIHIYILVFTCIRTYILYTHHFCTQSPSSNLRRIAFYNYPKIFSCKKFVPRLGIGCDEEFLMVGCLASFSCVYVHIALL